MKGGDPLKLQIKRIENTRVTTACQLPAGYTCDS